MEDLNMYSEKYKSDTSEEAHSETEDSLQSFQVKISDQIMMKHTLLLPNNIRNSKRDRLPTRQPNPSVHNRNALLARENRRKKKAHMEILEKDLQEAINTNNKLLKALNKQLKIVKKLEKEKIYYKSILTKQPKIQRLLTALNCRLDHNAKHNINFDYTQEELFKIPKEAHEDNICSPNRSSVYEQEGSVLSLDTSDVSGVTKTTIEQDLFLSSYQSSPGMSYESFTDSEPFSSLNNDWSDWYDIKGESVIDDIIHQSIDYPESTNNYSSINNVCFSNDHSYVSSKVNAIKSPEEDDVGFCIHIGENKVTLDFCPSCHLNARRASLE